MNKVISIERGRVKEPVYEVIGIDKDNKIIVYKEGTLGEIVDDELLGDGETEFNTMDDVIKNMDIFSNYMHYYRRVK